MIPLHFYLQKLKYDTISKSALFKVILFMHLFIGGDLYLVKQMKVSLKMRRYKQSWKESRIKRVKEKILI